jgi:ATP-dependent DNA helicase RecG
MNEETILDFIKKGESDYKEAGIIEKYGSGIKRVLETIRSYGLKDPSFEEIQDGFLVTFFKTTQKTTQKATQKTTQKTSTKDQILDFLRENPNLTRSEMAQLLGKSQNTIEYENIGIKDDPRRHFFSF